MNRMVLIFLYFPVNSHKFLVYAQLIFRFSGGIILPVNVTLYILSHHIYIYTLFCFEVTVFFSFINGSGGNVS